MKMYRVKNEFVDLFSSETEFAENPVIDETELFRLAREWGITVDEIMRQVDEIE